MAATATLAVVSLRHSSPFLHIPQPVTTTHIPTTRRPKLRPLQAQQQPTPRGFGSTNNLSSQSKQDQDQEKENNTSTKKEGEGEDEIPQEVIKRMAVRVVASVMMPMGLGLVLLSGFGTLKDQNVLDVPFWVPVATSLLTFGASALGIAYGALSSSWDPDRKGSVLGLEQLERNWVELWKE